MTGARPARYEQIASGITDAIVASAGAPAESVRVLFTEVSHDRYAVAGVMLRDRMTPQPAGSE